MNKPIRQHRVAASFMSKITRSFLDTIYAYLDGMVSLASDEGEGVVERTMINASDANGGGDAGQIVTGSRAELVDLSDMVRLFERKGRENYK